MDIEMTGIEDREGPWKLAVCGPPGAGKTLFSSTAHSPLFAFFQQEPRIKSIADRAVPHVKLVNDFAGGGSALDKLHALLLHLKFEEHGFETFVVDTGDELFQSMKASRAFANGGEFTIGDWSWIADAYREVMLAIIDLPMNVIVTFHTKLSQDEDVMYKELMLQGQAKDEAPGWFDIVGALDTFEVVDADGNAHTKRVLLTSSSRTYPWVKDHSWRLPRRFELSPGITDDFPRLLKLASSTEGEVAPREIIGEVKPMETPEIHTPEGIPSPEDLDAKKQEVNEISQPPPQPSDVAIDSPSEDPPPSAPEDTLPPESVEGKAPKSTGAASAVEGSGKPDSQEQVEPASEAVTDSESEDLVTAEEAVDAVVDIMEAEEVHVCAECNEVVTDSDLRDLTQIRFRKYLCREHFKEAIG